MYTVTVSSIHDDKLLVMSSIPTFTSAFTQYKDALWAMAKSHGQMRRVVMHKDDLIYLDCRLGEQIS